ncbi:MAG: nitrilase-related carbon-nitrogen hydrolase [Pseudomonadota bacterium]
MAELKLAVWQSPGELLGLQARLAWLSAQCEAASNTDLAVLPELFLSGYHAGVETLADTARSVPDALDVIAALARRYRIALTFGYPELASDGLYNSACLVDAEGVVQLRHRKRVLPPGFEADCFASGDSACRVETVCGVRVALLICFEVEFPEAVRACAAAGAELVLVPTALEHDWAIVSEKLVPARAFENTVFVAYANHAGVEAGHCYLGGSCIVSATGADLARAGAEPATVVATIDTAIIPPLRARLPFLAQYRKLL